MSLNVKSIQNIMRKDVGVDGDAQRIGQLTWMLFLKIFDDREMEYELDDNYQSPLPEELRWRNWAADSEGITGEELMEFVNNRLFPALKELDADAVSNPQGLLIREAFTDSFNYMKSGTLLRQVINEINSLDFTSSEERHLFNDIYETILRDLQSAGNAGEYYTPRAVTQFMVDMTDPKIGQKVLDPACGTGGFLVCAYNHVNDKYVKGVEDRELLQKSILGIEKKPLPYILAVTNLISHGIEVPQIRHDNSLARPLRDYGGKDMVDIIVTNPPFGGMEEDGIESNFPAAFQTRETADLFLVLIMTLLKPGGKAAIVLPDGTLFGEGVKTRIKEKLLNECNLHTIVRLPNGVFAPYTGINTNLLFFTKGEPTKEIWYFEHPYPEGYKSYSKTKPITIKEFDMEKGWWNDREENQYAWKVSAEQVKTNNYNLDINNPNVMDEAQRDPAELLREYRVLEKKLQASRDELKNQLMAALGGNS
jgi:Type I restriction-modification system methyltransferase subunit